MWLDDEYCELTEEELAAWPTCSVPDCEYKVWCAGNTGMCYPHSHGRNPIPFEEYMAASANRKSKTLLRGVRLPSYAGIAQPRERELS